MLGYLGEWIVMGIIYIDKAWIWWKRNWHEPVGFVLGAVLALIFAVLAWGYYFLFGRWRWRLGDDMRLRLSDSEIIEKHNLSMLDPRPLPDDRV